MQLEFADSWKLKYLRKILQFKKKRERERTKGKKNLSF